MVNDSSVKASDKVHLNHTNVLIFSILSDLSTYQSWWPKAKITKVDETTIKVSPVGPGSFTWRISEIQEDKKVVLAYDGIFSGQGIWSIEKDGAMTWLTYSVDLTIEHKFFQILNKFMPISKLHSKMMLKVFRELDRYLNNYHAKH